MAVSPTTQTLERAVRAFVAAGSGLDSKYVLEGNPKAGATPDGLYATVLLVTSLGQGLPYRRPDDDGLGDAYDVQTVQTVRARFSVQFFRDGARDAARRFRVWARSPAGIDYRTERNLTLNRLSDIRRLDAVSLDVVAGDAWEERAAIDCDIGYLETVSQSVGAIDSATATFRPDGADSEELEITA